MIDYTEEYPKTTFAMYALASAFEEESAGKTDITRRAIATTAIAGTAMTLANIMTGKTASHETYNNATIEECLRMLNMCLEGTMAYIKEEGIYEPHTN